MTKRAFPFGREIQKRPRKKHQPSPGERSNSAAAYKSWLVGALKLPSPSSSEHEAELIIWMSKEGFVLNADPCEQLDAESLIQSFEKTVADPQAGRPGFPDSIRTSSAALAEWLREHLEDRVQVVVADTPELDGVAQTLKSFGSVPREQPGRPTYFSPGIEERHASSFFASAASLYRAQPWRIVKSDTDVIGVRVPSLQIENAAAIIIGQNGQCYGILVFANYEGFVSYVTLAKAHANGAESRTSVDFLSLNYERAQDLDPALRAEVKKYAWPIAGPMAYPWPIVVGENWSTRAVSLKELTLLAAFADVLPRFLTETRYFQNSSVTRASFKQSFRIAFAGQPIDIELEFPHSAETSDDAA